nr:fimbrial protein [uncultured Erwinia sp.]
MFKKISILILLLNMGAVSQAGPTENQGWGRVRMTGSIVDAACAIDINSTDQTIDMGPVPVSRVIKGSYGIRKKLSINLVNCILSKDKTEPGKWRYFTITFDGVNDDGLFSVEGDAKGIAIKIIDDNGNIARPGESLPSENIESGSMALNFSLQLVSNNQELHAGEFNSIIKFKMDYY